MRTGNWVKVVLSMEQKVLLTPMSMKCLTQGLTSLVCQDYCSVCDFIRAALSPLLLSRTSCCGTPRRSCSYPRSAFWVFEEETVEACIFDEISGQIKLRRTDNSFRLLCNGEQPAHATGKSERFGKEWSRDSTITMYYSNESDLITRLVDEADKFRSLMG